jgi:Ser/Thr protein kinase RdoA (MazF antagonist)
MMARKSFMSLTQRGKARRLRAMAFDALAHYDLEVRRLRLITNDFNGIFRVDAADGRKLILRIAVPAGRHGFSQFEAEMSWLAALSRDTDLSIPEPVSARDGQRVLRIETPGVPEPRLCMLFTWVPGTDLADRFNLQAAAEWGRLTAQLNEHSVGFALPDGLNILRYDSVFPFLEPVVLFEPEHAALFPPERRKIYADGIGWAQQAIDRLSASGTPMQLIHGDLHLYNIRSYRNLLSPIDFEDLMWGWPVQDIGTALFYISGREDAAAVRTAFQAGYTQDRAGPESHPGEIDAFIAARGIGLVNFVIQEAETDWDLDIPEFVGRIENRVRTLLEKHR